MKEAKFVHKKNGNWQCTLCPHNCIVKPGKYGICNVRKNDKGKMVTEVYDKISAIHTDPIEKKPLYHFYPGRSIISIGSIGCNLKCKFCQNWGISQASCEDYQYMKSFSVNDVVRYALNDPENLGIAYTYNEPTVWFEYMHDIAIKIKENNQKNVMVTNAYINAEPLRELLHDMDAFSVDLKAFKNGFYKSETLSSLDPVKQSIKIIAKSECFLEITNLVIPGLNDDRHDFKEMINWIYNECGAETVLHISRYFPNYKMHIEPTTEKKMLELYEIASDKLQYVFLGNMRTSKGSNTYCPQCKSLAINRITYTAKLSGLDKTGKCTQCGYQIINHI